MRLRRHALVLAALLPAAARVARAQDSTDTATFAFAGVAFASSLGVDLSHSTRAGAGAYVRDLAIGTGEPVGAATVVALYLTVRLPDGTTVDAGAVLLTARLLPGLFVPGVDAGLRGMRVGGRRQIVVPTRSAFGHSGRPGVPPDSPLVVEARVERAGD